MRWWMKLALQQGFARLPRGDRLYRHIQSRFGEIAHLEQSARFDNAILILRKAREHAAAGKAPHVVELGTGWIPAVPLAFMLAGARVDTFDVTQFVRPDCFVRCRDEIARRLPDFAAAAGIPESEMASRIGRIASANDFATAAQILGGSYQAPCDTQHLPLQNGQVDVVVSNLVLQCIPRKLLPGVLKESNRILTPDGVAIHRIWMGDEYAAGDPFRNHLDYLRYSQRTWDRFFNHPIKHLNRLRLPQFITMLEEAGFETVDCRKTVDEDSILHLRKRGIAAEFRDLSWEDVATVSADLVLRKSGS